MSSIIRPHSQVRITCSSRQAHVHEVLRFLCAQAAANTAKQKLETAKARLAAAQKREARLPTGDASGDGAARTAAKVAEDALRRVADAVAAVEEASEALREAKRRVSLATTTSTLKRLISAFTALQGAEPATLLKEESASIAAEPSVSTVVPLNGASHPIVVEDKLRVASELQQELQQQQQQQLNGARSPAPINGAGSEAVPEVMQPTQAQLSHDALAQVPQEGQCSQVQAEPDTAQSSQPSSAPQPQRSQEHWHPQPTLRAEPGTQEQTQHLDDGQARQQQQQQQQPQRLGVLAARCALPSTLRFFHCRGDVE